jgi:DNA polymerase-4
MCGTGICPATLRGLPRRLAPDPRHLRPLLDEAYLDVSLDLRRLQTASATAKAIRARILEEMGLAASAGISHNKFLAKLASSQRKPNEQFVITLEMGPDFIASLPVARFHSVGPATSLDFSNLPPIGLLSEVLAA